MKDIDNFILRWRNFFGFSQSEFADKVGVSRKQVSYWENGKSGINDSTKRTIAENLNIPYQEFLNGPEEYEKRRRHKEDSLSNQQIPLDINRVSRVFLLSDIGEKIDDRTRFMGFTFHHQLEKEPGRWFNVIVDKPDQPLKQKDVAFVCDYVNPVPGDIVLVWDTVEGSRFVIWNEGDTYESYPSVLGVSMERL